MISIILPTYNEKDNIVELILVIDREVKGAKEIIVVDDNSPDGTSRAVRDLIKKGTAGNLRLETRKTDRGLTKSIWRGVELSRGDIIVWMDCDFSMPPEKISELVAKVKAGFDIAVGSRFVRGGGFKKNVGGTPDSLLAVVLSRLMNYIIQLFLDRRFKDYTSGFIAVRKKVFDHIRLQGDYGEYFIDLMCRAILAGYTFVEIPYNCLPRQKGQSKTGSSLKQLVRRGSKYLHVMGQMFLLRIKYLLIPHYGHRSQSR